MEWQSIETAPKEENAEVLIYGVEGVELVWRGRGGDWLTNTGYSFNRNPTHWMPLPSPPKA